MKLDFYEVNRAELRATVEGGAARASRGKMPRRVALILAATLVIAAGAVAVGSRYYINWDGVLVESRTRIPTQEEEDRWAEMGPIWDDLIQDAPDDEYWYLGTAYLDSMQVAPHEFLEANTSELEQRMANSPLLVPAAPPKDAVYNTSTLMFYFTPETYRNTEVYSEQDMGNGITLRKARPPKEYFDCVGGYLLRYTLAGNPALDGEWPMLSIDAEYVVGRTNGVFQENPDEQYEPVSVKGMAKALYVDRGTTRRLLLLQTSIPTIMSVTAFDFASKLDPEPINSATYNLVTNTLTKEELIAFAETLG